MSASQPQRRVLAIGDIHGTAHALETLLDAIAVRPEDQIITLGDYVDRGPDARRVIMPIRSSLLWCRRRR